MSWLFFPAEILARIVRHLPTDSDVVALALVHPRTRRTAQKALFGFQLTLDLRRTALLLRTLEESIECASYAAEACQVIVIASLRRWGENRTWEEEDAMGRLARGLPRVRGIVLKGHRVDMHDLSGCDSSHATRRMLILVFDTK